MSTDKFQLVPEKAWFSGTRHCPSPNFNLRPENTPIDLLVIHNISLPAGQFAGSYIDDLFCNRLDMDADPSFADLEGLEVSSHLLIRRDGEVVQYVGFDKRAWHAGVSTFQRRENCNDFSIGIELEGTDTLAYTDKQYQQLIKLIQSLQYYYPAISNQRIVGHSDIAPGRKTDPGVAFDWSYVLKQLEAK